MIHDHQLYAWIKAKLEANATISQLGVKRFEVADYPELPGPVPTEGGVKKALPCILLTKAEERNGWEDDGNGQTQTQTYHIKIKYGRLIESGEAPHIVMAADMAKVMDALANEWNLSPADLGEDAVPLQMEMSGDWDSTAEAMTSGSLYVCLGYFNIKIMVKQSVV